VNDLVAKKPWLPYVAPFAVYMFFLLLQSRVTISLLWLYPVKTIAVAGTLWAFRKHYPELRPNFSLLAVAVGLVAIIIWIAIDPYYPGLTKLMGSKPQPPFDPTSLGGAGKLWTFVAFRIVGAAVVVPVMEELFWRALVIRWLVEEDFKRVPVGTFTWLSFGATVFLFGVEHEQWIAGLICGALYNWLYYRRKDVFSCVIAHAVSNAALAGYVLVTGDWKFW
jgi:uncharacterized protein